MGVGGDGGSGDEGDGDDDLPFHPEPRNSASPIPKSSLEIGFLNSG